VVNSTRVIGNSDYGETRVISFVKISHASTVCGFGEERSVIAYPLRPERWRIQLRTDFFGFKLFATQRRTRGGDFCRTEASEDLAKEAEI